jgi:NTP pyrophosphatase (non-canonical NTP hydrolase)
MDNSIKDIAEKFLKEEKLPIPDALAFASLGLAKSIGEIAEITYGVSFSGHPYNDERKKETAEVMGDILFYWHILAIVSGIPWQDVMQSWISAWLVKNKTMFPDEFHISIREMLKHMKSKEKLKASTLKEKDEQERTNYK